MTLTPAADAAAVVALLIAFPWLTPFPHKLALGNFHPLKFLEISNVKFLESSGNFPGKFPVKFHPFWSVEISQRDTYSGNLRSLILATT